MKVKFLPFFFMMFTLLFQISIPESVIEFNQISPETVTDLADFNETDEDPSDDDGENNFEVIEVLYPILNIGHDIDLSPVLHTGKLPSFISSYVGKWHIPPSA